jgi:outer membrane protein assembly factor BamB
MVIQISAPICRPARQITGLSLIVLLVVLPQWGIAQPSQEKIRKLATSYYDSWIGVKAPEIGSDAVGRTTGPAVRLNAFHGKRVLLFTFASGDLHQNPDEKALLETLRAVDKARRAARPEMLAVVGFTKGPLLTWPGIGKPPGELGRLTDFPIVNVTNRTFNEPYNLLLTTGGIVIDSNGIFRAFYTHALSGKEFAEAAALPDWDRPVRPAPVEDPWAGKGPPKPLRKTKLAWSQPVARVMGMTAGDWDLRGPNDLIAVNSKGLLTLDPETGKVKRQVALAGTAAEDYLKEGLLPGWSPIMVQWAEIKRGRSAILLCREGWPDHVRVIGPDGTELWKYQTEDAVDSATWVDLRGTGGKELLVGFNGNGGLHAVTSDGGLLWKNQQIGNVWTVAGIDARANRPGLALSTEAEGKIHVFDASGKELRFLPNEGHYVTVFAAAEMNDAGLRQVLAFWPAIVGRLDYAVGMDLQGAVLWKYPVKGAETMSRASSVMAADLDGTGTKHWIISSGGGELAVLDTNGRLLARIENPGKPWWCWTAISRKNKPGWIVTADSDKISAYVLGALE